MLQNLEEFQILTLKNHQVDSRIHGYLLLCLYAEMRKVGMVRIRRVSEILNSPKVQKAVC